jgi:hypothetical protein
VEQPERPAASTLQQTTKDHFEDLDELGAQILAFEKHYNAAPTPFDWKFTRTDLNRLLPRIRQHDRHTPQPLAV